MGVGGHSCLVGLVIVGEFETSTFKLGSGFRVRGSWLHSVMVLA